MSKHTPGPWKLLKFEDDERYEVTTDDSTKSFYRSVATVSFGYSEPAETQQHANAKLIAAATELLAAAKLAEAALARGGWLDTSTDPEAVALRALRQAIARAIGEQS